MAKKILPPKSNDGLIIKLLVQTLLLSFSNSLKLEHLAREVDDLKAEVKKIPRVDPEEVRVLIDKLESNSQSLAKAVEDNKPKQITNLG